jgi:HD-like signal output (HDOD) protein
MGSKASLLEIIQAYLQSDRAVLPVFNRTGLRVQQEAAKPEPDLRIIEKLILGEPSLTAQVLRTANSAFFRGLNKVGTVHEALLRLGTNEVVTLVGIAAQRESYRSSDPAITALLALLWRHAVGCAIGAQWLARELGFASMSAEAMTAGLLHDVGKLLILKVIEALKRRGAMGTQPSEAFINEVLDNLHSSQGHQLLQRWNLPEAYCVVVRDHHADTFNTNDILLLLVRMADKACNRLGIGLRPDPTLSLETTPEAHLLGLSEIALARLEIRLEDAMALSA